MAKYRKRPVVVSEAVQVKFAKRTDDSFDGDAFSEMPPWMIQALQRSTVAETTESAQDYMTWKVKALRGELIADVGDFIIQNVGFDLDVMTAKDFLAAYELVEE